jgi:deoxyribose-phosphate aldolase
MLRSSTRHAVARRCYRAAVVRLETYIEHTLLAPEARAEDYARLCREALEHGLYGVCVPSARVAACAAMLRGGAKLVTVIGYPLGVVLTAAKVAEARAAVQAGADELDVVVDVGRLLDADEDAVRADLRAVVAACEGRPLKVILETGLLDEDAKRRGARLCMEAGAAFVKTCTGMPGRGVATAADVRTLRDVVGAHLGIKASGGIRTSRAALELIDAGATRIGTSAGPRLLAEHLEGTQT